MKRIAVVILLMWVASALSQVERVPAHVHLGHVITNRRDTPGNAGFLIAALSDAKVAVIHAQLAAKEENSREEIRLHVTHVLNALDSSIEPKGPGSGYGVKKAAAGALQHLGLAVAAEGATDNMLFRTVGHMLSLRVLHVSRVSNGKGVSRRPQRAIPGQPSALQSWQKAVPRIIESPLCGITRGSDYSPSIA